jgi:hypothetical protein
LLWEDPGVSHVVLTASFLGVAGIVAGITGTAGGITTLVAYPALLAVGIPPLAANVTNSVAMVGSGLGSASRAAPDITGQGATIRRWLPVTITMSVAGAVLLTPMGAAVEVRGSRAGQPRRRRARLPAAERVARHGDLPFLPAPGINLSQLAMMHRTQLAAQPIGHFPGNRHAVPAGS